MRSLALLALVAVGGCASALPFAAGGGLGVLATVQADVKISDTVLAVDAPLKELGCDMELAKPHGRQMTVFLQTYCANIPHSTQQAFETWTKVLGAMIVVDIEEQAGLSE